MVVTFTWGLIVMIIISLIVFGWIIAISIEDGEWSLLAVVPVFLILCLVWAVYGGVAWW
jgi:uncharacterized membrane protein YdjX (TVP38/TMEM64 family)